MKNGYAGKILRVNLTTGKISFIETEQYSSWVGGHGMAAAIFFDLVKDNIFQMKDGFHPANIVILMTSPLTGTLVPACAGRIEVVGVGVQSHPIGWFTRGCFGGRFATMLKHAGWDGIVIEGQSEHPVWLDIRDQEVFLRKCDELKLWGKDTRETQEEIWDYVARGKGYGSWIQPTGKVQALTTQRPAVVTIGPAGENVCRTACLIHDASNASGSGGFGAIWGLKKLKAISVIGTGGVHVHDPKALLAARLWLKQNYAFNLNTLRTTEIDLAAGAPPVPAALYGNWLAKKPGQIVFDRPTEDQRPQACTGCHSGCRARYRSGVSNEAGCVETHLCPDADSIDVQRKAADLLNRFGLNAWDMVFTLIYIRDLNKKGILGPGKKINCPLDFRHYGTFSFVEQFLRLAATKQFDGQDNAFAKEISQGAYRAAESWGRLKEDLKSGDLPYAHWGIPLHFDPRSELEWGYGNILSDRDVNEHDFENVWASHISFPDWLGKDPTLPAGELVNIILPKLVPFNNDPRILDYGDQNMYSGHMAKLVAWHRYYTRFWKVTVQFCDWRWPDFINLNHPSKVGCTGEAEPRFFNAVTGQKLTFLEGILLGQKIWNLDRAIWTLQGRHRGQEKFAEFIYEKEAQGVPNGWKEFFPVLEQGHWRYKDCMGRKLDRNGVENFKTEFYRLMDWDVDTGYPTRAALAKLGLGEVAAVLAKYGKLK